MPELGTLPPAALAAAVKSSVSNPAKEQLPAKSITNFKGYLNIPAEGVWHFYLTLDQVDGSKAYLRMHRFQLVDADFSYKPGTTVNESAAINAEEAVAASTGKRGIPLAAGPHAIDFTIVQGESAPGKVKLEWEGPNTPRQEIPDAAFRSE